MNGLLPFIFDYADAEFNGKSFNGPSFMATLRSLDEKAAFDTDTFEGYSAWEIAQHVCYYKIMLVRDIDDIFGKTADKRLSDKLEPLPFEFKDFAAMPDDRTPASWIKTLDYIEMAHNLCMKMIRELSADVLEKIKPQWNISFGSIIAWMFTHDAYHAAQLRNIGVPGLKKAKIQG
jgi:hypothetical protein